MDSTLEMARLRRRRSKSAAGRRCWSGLLSAQLKPALPPFPGKVMDRGFRMSVGKACAGASQRDGLGSRAIGKCKCPRHWLRIGWAQTQLSPGNPSAPQAFAQVLDAIRKGELTVTLVTGIAIELVLPASTCSGEEVVPNSHRSEIDGRGRQAHGSSRRPSPA